MSMSSGERRFLLGQLMKYYSKCHSISNLCIIKYLALRHPLTCPRCFFSELLCNKGVHAQVSLPESCRTDSFSTDRPSPHLMHVTAVSAAGMYFTTNSINLFLGRLLTCLHPFRLSPPEN